MCKRTCVAKNTVEPSDRVSNASSLTNSSVRSNAMPDSVSRFNEELNNCVRETMTLLATRGLIPKESLERKIVDLYVAIRREKKIEHLKKGEPMETIKFNSQVMQDTREVIGAHFNCSAELNLKRERL